MKLSSLAFAASLALGSAGAMAGGGPIDLSSGSTFFGSTPVAGGFVDTFTFTLLSASTLTASIVSVVGGGQDVDFNYVALTGPSGVFAFTTFSPDPFEVLTLTTGVLAAGAYSFSVIGTNTPAIGSYSGTVAISVVPEPETAALLLAGLLAVGFVSSRRQS